MSRCLAVSLALAILLSESENATSNMAALPSLINLTLIEANADVRKYQ